MAINEDLQCFICLACAQAYHGKNITSHLQRTHSISITTALLANIQSVIDASTIVVKYMPMTPFKDAFYKEFVGIKMEKEWGCPVCPVAGDKKYVRNHLSGQHSDHKNLPLEPNIYTQVLNKAMTKTKLRVIPRSIQSDVNSTDPATEWSNRFINSHTTLLNQTRSIPNARHISPWLMRTSWHILIENINVNDLRMLVSLPGKEDNLGWVHSLVVQYLQKASAMIKDTQMQTLQRINSSNPDHEYVC